MALRFLVSGIAVALWVLVPAALAQVGPEGEGPPPAPVTVVEARIMKLSPKLELPGTVIARNDSRLASEVSGRVAWVAEVGTQVEAGGIIAKIDQELLTLQLAEDEANVQRLEASLKYERQEVARIQKLAASKTVSASRLDEAVARRDMTAAELERAKATRDRTNYQVARSDIRAPFPGRVVARLIQVGEFVSPGKEVVRLVDTTEIEVRTQAPISAAPFVEDGMALDIEIQGQRRVAVVRAIVPVGNEISRTFEIRLALDPRGAIVGDAAKVFVPSAEAREATVVPRDALVLRETSTYVFRVRDDGIAERIAVQTGAAEGPMIEIRGMIAAGDKIIVRGAEHLEAGQKVAVTLAS